MKTRRTLLTLLFASAISFFFVNEIISNANGPAAGFADSPLDGGNSCGNSSCHNVALNTGTSQYFMSTDVPGTGYVPGNTYTITATGIDGAHVRAGFQILAGYGDSTGVHEGSVTITDPTRTQLRSSASGEYVTHLFAGTDNSTGTIVWEFDWTAPSTDVGPISFHGAFNGANNNGMASGDEIYTSSLTIFPMAVSVEEELISSVNVYPTMVTDELVIESANAGLGDVDIRILDLSGKVVFDQSNPASMHNKEVVNANGWNSGIYFVQIVGESTAKTVKVVKL